MADEWLIAMSCAYCRARRVFRWNCVPRCHVSNWTYRASVRPLRGVCCRRSRVRCTAKKMIWWRSRIRYRIRLPDATIIFTTSSSSSNTTPTITTPINTSNITNITWPTNLATAVYPATPVRSTKIRLTIRRWIFLYLYIFVRRGTSYIHVPHYERTRTAVHVRIVRST